MYCNKALTITMDTLELTCALTCNKYTRKVFTGVYPVDMLPTHVKPPIFLIWNKDPSYLPGSHWLALHVPVEGPIEYFDSLNLKTSKYIIQYATIFNRNIVRNQHRIQDLFSDVCGQYCAMYILCRAKGILFTTFLNTFTMGEHKMNDTLVQNMYKKSFCCKISSSRNKKKKNSQCNQICKACLCK